MVLIRALHLLGFIISRLPSSISGSWVQFPFGANFWDGFKKNPLALVIGSQGEPRWRALNTRGFVYLIELKSVKQAIIKILSLEEKKH